MSGSITTDAATEGGVDYGWLPAGFTVTEVNTNGITISAAVAGSGPTMVLLHGWPQTGRAWRHVMGRLAESYTVVVPDLRGAGASSRPLGGYRKTNQVEDMRGLLSALQLSGKPIVVGHDIGAMVALAWAAKYPAEVASLVTLDAAFPGLGLEQLMDVANGGMWHFGLFMQPHVPEILFDGHELEFISSSFRAISKPNTFTDEDLAVYARAYQGRDRLRGGFSQYHDLLEDGRDIRELLDGRTLPMPVLAVGGADRMGESVADALRPYAPELTGMVAPTGHFIAEEASEWLLVTLRDFLDRPQRALSDLRPHHVALSVGDLDGLIAWWIEKLDFRAGETQELPMQGIRAVVLDRGDFRMELFEVPDSTSGTKYPDQITAMSERGLTHFGFQVPDVRAAYEALSNRGVEFPVPPIEYERDMPSAFFQDPEGNLFELVQAPKVGQIQTA